MRANTQTVSIDMEPEAVRAFLAEPGNLPRWAVGFAKSVRRGPDGWLVTTAGGEVPIEVVTVPGAGTVDFKMMPAPGVVALAACRALPCGAGTEVVFTQFQAPAMPDGVFEKNIAAVAHELRVLKAVLEVQCPL